MILLHYLITLTSITSWCIHSEVAVGVTVLCEWSVNEEAEPADEYVLQRAELLRRREGHSE